MKIKAIKHGKNFAITTNSNPTHLISVGLPHELGVEPYLLCITFNLISPLDGYQYIGFSNDKNDLCFLRNGKIIKLPTTDYDIIYIKDVKEL